MLDGFSGPHRVQVFDSLTSVFLGERSPEFRGHRCLGLFGLRPLSSHLSERLNPKALLHRHSSPEVERRQP